MSTTTLVHQAAVATCEQSTMPTPWFDGKAPGHANLKRLHQLATGRATAFAIRAAAAERFTIDRLGTEYYKLAVDVTSRPLIKTSDLLSIFLEQSAIDMLLRLPNTFWFWNILRQSLTFAGIENQERIKVEHVVGAMAIAHVAMQEHFNFEITIDELSPAEAARRVIEGVILLSQPPYRAPELKANPLFQQLTQYDSIYTVREQLLARFNAL